MDYFKPALPSAAWHRHSICLSAGAAQCTSPEELCFPQEAKNQQAQKKPGKKNVAEKKTKNLSRGRLCCFQTATLSPGGYSKLRQMCANSNRGGCKQQHASQAGLHTVGALGAQSSTRNQTQSDGKKPGFRQHRIAAALKANK